MILLLDNYDSFTYNLAQYLGELGCQVEVHRNDKITVDDIIRRKPDRIVISPGPCTPKEAGISVELVQRLTGKFPILGVCLGHQAIGAAFGGKVIRAPKLFHGKASAIHHDSKGVFRKLADPFTATRYHSLIVERKSLPRELDHHRRNHRRHHHGRPPPPPQTRRSPVPPRIRPNRIRQTTPPKLPLPLTKSLLAKPHSNRPTHESIPTRHSERSRPTLFLRVHFL